MLLDKNSLDDLLIQTLRVVNDNASVLVDLDIVMLLQAEIELTDSVMCYRLTIRGTRAPLVFGDHSTAQLSCANRLAMSTASW